MKNLKEIFISFLSQYSDNQLLISEIWQELECFYSEKHRHYHTLQHIEHLYFLLESEREQIEDWETLMWSIFYHDMIYNPSKSDNEEKSAEKMREIATKLSVSEIVIEKAYRQIIATKKHEMTGDNDTDLFTDADLAILGSDWTGYEAYAKNIRKEYSIYPNFMYNMGRKKVLKHFLQMENIYKTPLFRAKLEEKARKNLQNELEIVLK